MVLALQRQVTVRVIRHRTTWRMAIFLLLGSLLALADAPDAHGVEKIAPESTLKVAYLFQIANFVDWPGTGEDHSRPLRLCILGEDPFGTAIDAIAGKKAKGRELALRRFDTADGIEDCLSLFIGASQGNRLEGILEILHGESVLTVGDGRDFVRCGGMVGLVSRRRSCGWISTWEQRGRPGCGSAPSCSSSPGSSGTAEPA